MRFRLLVTSVAAVAVLLASMATSDVAAARATVPGNPGDIPISMQLVRSQTGPDAIIPEGPGAAVSNAIGYDYNLWAVLWKCSYAGWLSGLNVRWTCRLHDLWTNQVLSSKTGTTSSGSANPGPWYYFNGNPFGVCVYAEAHYTAYPSIKDTDWRCG